MVGSSISGWHKGKFKVRFLFVSDYSLRFLRCGQSLCCHYRPKLFSMPYSPWQIGLALSEEANEPWIVNVPVSSLARILQDEAENPAVAAYVLFARGLPLRQIPGRGLNDQSPPVNAGVCFPEWKFALPHLPIRVWNRDISIPYSDGKMRKSKFSFWKTYSCIHRRRLIIQSPPGNLP